MSKNGLLPARPAVLATAAVLAVGCGGSSTHYPTQPSPSSTPATTAVTAAERWTLTEEVIGASGNFCLVLPEVGQSWATTFSLVRGEKAVSFLMGDPMDWQSYPDIAVNGLAFEGAVPTTDSSKGMCAHYRQDYSLAGSFSDDRTHLTATETWKFTLDSGEVVTRTFRWAASSDPWGY